MYSQSDVQYMRRCLQLARCGRGSTSPNPMVGAVVVCDGRIIGEGYHVRAGEPHAEVNAIRSVKAADRHLLLKSTMYVTLEPCSHFGKTPPCCDMIISHGIPRVVIGISDSNCQVNGAGISRMCAAGIDVEVGVLKDECYRLNRAFFTMHNHSRPMVTLKWAQTADGFIDAIRSCGKPLAISTELSRVAVHKLRAEHDAILVGTRTALMDDPSLDIRYWAGRSPMRLVIDRKGVLPLSLRLFDGTLPTVVYTMAVRKELRGKNIEQVKLRDGEGEISQILAHLHSRGVCSLLVEGGALLIRSFIESSLWDVARVEVNNSLVAGSGVPAPSFDASVKPVRVVSGGNEILFFERKNPI